MTENIVEDQYGFTVPALSRRWHLSEATVRRILDAMRVGRVGYARFLPPERVGEFQEELRKRGLIRVEPTPAA